MEELFIDSSFSLVSNFMLAVNFAFKETRLHMTKHQTKTIIVNNKHSCDKKINDTHIFLAI